MPTRDSARTRAVGDFRSQLDLWKNQVQALTVAIEDARRVRAGVVLEKAALIRLQDMVQQAQRDLDEKNFKQITESLDRLKQEGQNIQSHSQRVHKETGDTQQYARQADLLFLQAPPDTVNNRVGYTLLLRTPSEPGSHGINIQDTSTLGAQDHDEMKRIISRITAAIEQGAVRSASLPAAPAPATPAAPRVDRARRQAAPLWTRFSGAERASTSTAPRRARAWNWSTTANCSSRSVT